MEKMVDIAANTFIGACTLFGVLTLIVLVASVGNIFGGALGSFVACFLTVLVLIPSYVVGKIMFNG